MMDITYQLDVIVRLLTYAGSAAGVGKVKNEFHNRIVFKKPVLRGNILFPPLANVTRALREIYGVNEKLSAFFYYQDSEKDLIRLSIDKEWRELIRDKLKSLAGNNEGTLVINLLFSPKHHYKANIHGVVDFTALNFENSVIDATEKILSNLNVKPKEPSETAVCESKQTGNDTGEPIEHKLETIAPNNEPETSPKADESTNDQVLVAETQKEEPPVDDQKVGCSSQNPGSHGGGDVEVPPYDTVLTDTPSEAALKLTQTPSEPASNQSLPDVCDRVELIEFVKNRIPGLVDEYLNVMGKSNVKITSMQKEDHKFSETVSEECGVSSEDIMTEQTEEKLICFEEEINTNTEANSLTNFDKMEAVKMEHSVNFLFHENVNAQMVAIPGTQIHKTWFVENSGSTTWPSNAFISLQNLVGVFIIKSSSVSALAPGDFGSVSVCMEVPRKCGMYHLNFIIKCDDLNVFQIDKDLTCSINVVDNAIEFAKSCMTMNCFVSATDNVTAAEVTDKASQSDECGEKEDEGDDEVTSMCEDETVVDEEFSSADEDFEMTDDFTIIPVPDCFDLKVAPGLQSSFYQQKKNPSCESLKVDPLISADGDKQLEQNEVAVELTDVKENDEDKVLALNENHDGSTSELDSINTVVEVAVENDEEIDCDANKMAVASAECTAAEEGGHEVKEIPCDNSSENGATMIVNPSEEKNLLDRLNKLGFGDRAKNKKLLLKNNYKLQDVIRDLVAEFEPLRE